MQCVVLAGLMSKSSRQQHGVLFDIGQLDDQKHQLRFLGLKKGTCKWLHCFTSILGPDLQPNVLCAGGPGGILVYDLRSDKVRIMLALTCCHDKYVLPMFFKRSGNASMAASQEFASR